MTEWVEKRTERGDHRRPRPRVSRGAKAMGLRRGVQGNRELPRRDERTNLFDGYVAPAAPLLVRGPQSRVGAPKRFTRGSLARFKQVGSRIGCETPTIR